MNRRKLLLGLLAAPVVVRAESLMPIYVAPLILTGNLNICEADIIEAAWAGKYVLDKNRRRLGRIVHGQTFAIQRPLVHSPSAEDIQFGLSRCSIYGLRPWSGFVPVPNVPVTNVLKLKVG